MGKVVVIVCMVWLNCAALPFGLAFSGTDAVGLRANQEGQPPPLVGDRGKACEPYEETLKEGSPYTGESVRLGDSPGTTPVFWTTGTDGRYDALVTMHYMGKSSEYVEDTETPNGSVKLDSETVYALSYGYDKADIGGCSLKHVRIGEVYESMGSAGAFGLTGAMGGLAPIPGESTHPYLGGRPPRLSFCFGSPLGKEGKLIWGAAEPPVDEKHTRLRVTGGMKGHHWAVNVTGFAVANPKGGPKAWLPLADEVREENVDNKSAYWLALFDTSSTLLSVPKEVLEELQQYLDERNVVDCENTSYLPSIMIKLDDDGKQFFIPPESYLSNAGSTLMQTYRSCASCSSFLGGNHSFDAPLHFAPKYKIGDPIPAGKCALMLAPPSPYPGVFVLGMAFLKSYTTTFDFENREIVASKIPCDGAVASPEGLSGAGRAAPAVALALPLLAGLLAVL